MIQLKYDTLFTIKIEHSYYASNISRDFSIIPSLGTAALLKEYGLKWNDSNGELMVLCRKNPDGTPDTPIDRNITLTFFLVLNNASFGNFSELRNISELENIRRFYFSNLDGDGNMQNKLTTAEKLTAVDALPEILPQRFNWSIEKGIYKSIQFYRVIPDSGLTEIKDLNIGITPDKETIEINIPQPGLYTLIMKKTDDSEPNEVDYFINDEATSKSNFFGVIELFLDQEIHTQPAQYTISIAHKTLKWRYFLMDNKELLPVDKDNDKVADVKDGKLILERSEGAEPSSIKIIYTGVPELPSGVSFKQQQTPSQADQKLIALMKKEPNIANVYLFESDVAIPILERNKPKIQLLKKESFIDTEVPLPVPTAETFNATIFINI